MTFLVSPAWHVGVSQQLTGCEPWGSDCHVIQPDLGVDAVATRLVCPDRPGRSALGGQPTSGLGAGLSGRLHAVRPGDNRCPGLEPAGRRGHHERAARQGGLCRFAMVWLSDFVAIRAVVRLADPPCARPALRLCSARARRIPAAPDDASCVAQHAAADLRLCQ
jgi:hypothetical protein